jgi:hypothetical protein
VIWYQEDSNYPSLYIRSDRTSNTTHQSLRKLPYVLLDGSLVALGVVFAQSGSGQRVGAV